MGSRKRRVEPLSAQPKVADFGASAMGITVYPSEFRLIFAPKDWRQSAVASISRLVSGHIIVVSLSAKAAQIRYRCAWDFEGMGVTVPDNFPGCMVISISKTCLDKGLDFGDLGGGYDAIANGSGKDQTYRTAASFFVG